MKVNNFDIPNYNNMKVFGDSDPIHNDHGILPEHFNFVNTHPELLALPKDEFMVRWLAMPDHLSDAPSALYGPNAGDDVVKDSDSRVYYIKRGDRSGDSRCINAPFRPARNLVVVGIRGGVCFTLYGTQSLVPSPKEPWDENFENEEERENAKQFWAEHALAKEI